MPDKNLMATILNLDLLQPDTSQGTTALYIHWPFCVSKCPYCDFNSHVRERINPDEWQKSYASELAYYKYLLPNRTISSVFFGGGTPSLMPVSLVAFMVETIKKQWHCVDDIEITLEANPTSVEAEKFAGLAAAGVNRLSLGVQSLRDEALSFLGRPHNAMEARGAIELALRYFPRMSFDLIYARPQQSLKDWETELKEALAFGINHLSLYQLTIEQGTPFARLYDQGRLHMPAEELAGDMYQATAEMLEQAGLPRYEISNHAAKGQESRHNLTYWRYGEYIGIGPGAHGRLRLHHEGGLNAWATRVQRVPENWAKKLLLQPVGLDEITHLSEHEQWVEALMMGLRLAEGVAIERLNQISLTNNLVLLQSGRLERLQQEGLLWVNEQHITATDEGMTRLNGLLKYMLESY
ncbi:MAG: radical SAM family heme chaperone HemW [Alphaproteobacteria bacterium]